MQTRQCSLHCLYNLILIFLPGATSNFPIFYFFVYSSKSGSFISLGHMFSLSCLYTFACRSPPFLSDSVFAHFPSSSQPILTIVHAQSEGPCLLRSFPSLPSLNSLSSHCLYHALGNWSHNAFWHLLCCCCLKLLFISHAAIWLFINLCLVSTTRSQTCQGQRPCLIILCIPHSI